MKINANFNIFASKNFDSSEYIDSPSFGVKRFMLDRIGNEKARATTIVEYYPNSRFPEHTHIGGEEFFVLQGTFCDEHGSYPMGTYVRNPIGSHHNPYVTNDGCVIVVKLLQMSDVGDVSEPLYINTATTKQQQQQSDSPNDLALSIQRQHLFTNHMTGEIVEMVWIQPNQQFVIDDDISSKDGGEELFIVDGSLLSREHEYKKWGWLRFPPFGTSTFNNNNDNTYNDDNNVDVNNNDGREVRQQLHAGMNGVQILRKTGHLSEKALRMEKIQFDTNENICIK